MLSWPTARYADLRQWGEAKAIAERGGDVAAARELVKRQAAWAEEVGDWRAAAAMHAATHHHHAQAAAAGGGDRSHGGRLRAIRILGERGGWKELIGTSARCSLLTSDDVSFF